MKKTFMTELTPVNGRKSFGGKARVIESGGSHYLLSYDTVVGGVDRDGTVHRYWAGKTPTTNNHIKNFLLQFTDLKNTKDFYGLPVENRPVISI